MYLSLMTRCKLQIMARIIALAIMLMGLPVGAQASSYTETQLIQRAEQAISKISTLQAKFLQVSSDGSVGEGVLYFRRPTQLRLEYQNPNTLTLITSRVWLYVDDKIAKSVQAIPLGQTPLSPLLKKTVSFRSEEFATSASARDGIAVISMRKEDGDAAGWVKIDIIYRDSDPFLGLGVYESVVFNMYIISLVLSRYNREDRTMSAVSWHMQSYTKGPAYNA